MKREDGEKGKKKGKGNEERKEKGMGRTAMCK